MSRYWVWQRLVALIALVGCGEVTADGGDATGGRAVSAGGASGTNPGSSGGSAGSRGESESALVTDIEAITGESFVNTDPSCLVFLEDEVCGAEAGCTQWVFHFRALGRNEIELIAYTDSLEFLSGGNPISRARLRKEDKSWVLADDLTLTWPRPNEALESNALHFRFYDQDGNGRADAVQAQGPARYIVASDDYSTDFPVEYSFRGLPDRRSPMLVVTAAALPNEFARFSASEPLAEGSRATLTVGADVLALEPEIEAGVVHGFTPTRLLWPDSEGDLRVAGSDLAGNPIDSRSHVSVGSVPAVASPDFESDAPFFAAKSSSFCVADEPSGPRENYDALSALEGQRSFLVAWGNRVLLHLKRPLNTSTLRLSLRVLSSNASSGPNMEVSLLGGTHIERKTPEVPLIDDDGLPPGAIRLFENEELANEVFAAETQELAFALTDEGEDVLLNIDAPCAEASTSFSVGAWLDDLRFE